MDNEMEVIEYDVRGQICPSCLLIALREINQHQTKIKNGELMFQILSDNRQSTITIPNTVNNMGYQTKILKEDEGYYRITIAAAGTTSE